MDGCLFYHFYLCYHASVFISQTFKRPYFVLWISNSLILCMWIGWMVFFLNVMKCFALHCVMCLSTLSKCALMYLCIRDSLVCIDFVGRFGISKCFFFLKGQNYVQTGISLGIYLTLDWFLTKNTCSINDFLSKLYDMLLFHNESGTSPNTPQASQSPSPSPAHINQFINLLKTNSIYGSTIPANRDRSLNVMNKHSWMFN